MGICDGLHLIDKQRLFYALLLGGFGTVLFVDDFQKCSTDFLNHPVAVSKVRKKTWKGNMEMRHGWWWWWWWWLISGCGCGGGGVGLVVLGLVVLVVGVVE